MDQRKFNETSQRGIDMLTAALISGKLGIDSGGEVMTYNAYLAGQEVVVLGFQHPDPAVPGSVLTKPLAVLMDDDLFARLRVDDEAGRIEDGQDAPRRVL